jgi:hypothetical protein
MNQTGWLDVNQRHEPLHQLSMRFQEGIRHLEEVAKSCIRDGAALLEPDDKSVFVEIPFKGDRPSCHINHSKHFTSHFRIYQSHSQGKTSHPYWGNFREYYPEEEAAPA